ncbi:MAG TPA: hypothetical protein VFW87_11390 [Pirellulales bacterium]|nr:hypothetical protein [Pirellulales bacterium]
MSSLRRASNDLRAAENAAQLPPEWVRTAVSFLLFVHLFAVLVGVLANWYPSPLATQLRTRVPLLAPYLESLDLDQAYVPLYGLTYGMDQDTDQRVEVDLKLADGTQRQFILPRRDLWPHQRYRREQRLAEVAADLVGDDTKSLESFLPQAIAAHFVAAAEASGATVVGGTIRCRRQAVPTMEAAASGRSATPETFDLYQAEILRVAGEVQLLKTEAAAEVAPAPNRRLTE